MTNPRFIVTLLAIIVAAGFDFVITFLPMHLDKELVTVILTALNTNGLVVAIQYWLGSSHDSAAKDDTIANLSQK